jgi:uncharacterized OB-fold protein
MFLKASKCHCGKVSVPPRVRCPLCGKPMEPTEVENKGLLLTYTIQHVAPEGYQAPIKVALVELEDGVKVFCNFDAELPIDSEVEVVPDGERLRIKS